MSTIETEIHRIGVVGCGVVGASWAAHFLARGFDVVANDPAPDAQERLRAVVDSAWPALERIGLAPGASRDRLRFEPDLSRAARDVDFVQENGPERLELKRDLIARIDAEARDDVLIATSTSGILVSALQDAARRPERVVVGHPFNPPHLIPLVEVVGGSRTSPETIARALRFYEAVGKKPIHVRREVKGHIANRLQAALWREAFHLIEQGAATVADVDAAIAHGPGLRWALLGPFLNLHLSGGPGGIGHAIDHLGPPIEDWWRDLGRPALSESLRAKAVEGVEAELDSRSFPAMIRQRDDLLLTLLALKAEADQLP